MSKRITVAIAVAAIVAATAGWAIANAADDDAEQGMPVPGNEQVDDTVIDDSAGMPVPGSDVDETIVTDDSSGMPVPGFEGTTDETVVEGGSSSGMIVPGLEGVVSDTVVEHSE